MALTILTGKRIFQLEQQIDLIGSLRLVVDNEAFGDAKYITMAQLLAIIGHAPLSLNIPNGLYLDTLTQVLSLQMASDSTPGAMPMLPNNANVFLNGVGGWSGIEVTPPLNVTDGMFKLSIVNNSLNIKPHATQPLVDPGIPYFHTETKAIKYSDPRLYLEGRLTASSFATSQQDPIEAIYNNTEVGFDGNQGVISVSQSHTGTSASLRMYMSMRAGVPTGVLVPTHHNTGLPTNLYIGSLAVYPTDRYLYLNATTGVFNINFDTIKLDRGTPNKYLFLNASKNIIYVDAPDGGGGTAGVTSFNTRDGIVTLTKLDVETALTGNIKTHWHDVEPLGISTLLDINSSVPIEEFFKPITYVNRQVNQFIIPPTLPDVGGTPITITAYNAGTRTMSLSYFPMLEAGEVASDWLISKSVGAEPSRGGQDQEYAKVVSVIRNVDGTAIVTWDSLTTRNISSWGINTTVFLINIKRGWLYNMNRPTFTISNVSGSWTNNALSQGGFYKTGSGNVRLVVNGYDTTGAMYPTTRTIGLARPTIENDMEGTWILDTYPRIHTTHFPTWCSTTGFVITSIINHPIIEGYFIGFGCTYDTIRRIGYVVFNEDMSSVTFSTSYLDLGDGGFYQPSVALFEGKYRMFLAELNNTSSPDSGAWTLGYYESIDPLSLVGWERKGTVGGDQITDIRNIKDCYKSSHTTEASLFTYNGDLYAFADGTSRWNASGNRGQRSIGLMHWNRKAWVNIPHGPVFVGYQFADTVWNLPHGHTGGIVSTVMVNREIYFVNSLTQVSDQYKIIISKKIRTNV